MCFWLFLLTVGISETQFEIHQIPLKGSDREVVLADRFLFPQMSWEESNSIKDQILKELDTRKDYIFARYGLLGYSVWNDQLTVKYCVWCQYTDLLHPSLKPTIHLERLYTIRHLIGEEEYRKGKLPDITSNWN
jgi:hypothetical protein